MHCSQGKSKLLFQMIPINIFSPKGFVEENFRMQLELSLNIKWVDHSNRKFLLKVSDVNVSGTLRNVRVMDNINLPTQSL